MVRLKIMTSNTKYLVVLHVVQYICEKVPAFQFIFVKFSGDWAVSYRKNSYVNVTAITGSAIGNRPLLSLWRINIITLCHWLTITLIYDFGFCPVPLDIPMLIALLLVNVNCLQISLEFKSMGMKTLPGESANKQYICWGKISEWRVWDKRWKQWILLFFECLSYLLLDREENHIYIQHLHPSYQWFIFNIKIFILSPIPTFLIVC